MGSQTKLNSREFVSQDLFAIGLIEFEGENFLAVRMYIDRALTDDMADIATHYQRDFGGI